MNEIRTLAAMAVRGAGLPWGTAEEAGRAAAWLEARSLAGLSALEGALERLSAPDWRLGFPVPKSETWRAESRGVDGLLAGMALADRADQPLPLAADGALTLVKVHWPLLTIPFLASVAQVCGAPLTASVEPELPAIRIGPQSVCESCRALEGLEFTEAVRIEALCDSATLPDLPRLDNNIPVDREVYTHLNWWATHTSVPESPESQALAHL